MPSSTNTNSKGAMSLTVKSSLTKNSSLEDPRANTLNYEYQEQPTVKLNLSPSELQFLDDDNKSQLTQSSASTMTVTEKPDRNGNRFLASVSVLATLGILGVGVNGIYGKANPLVISFIVIFFSLMVYEWHRVHGLTLSRRLRPVLNMASVFATYKYLDPDSACLYAADKDKYNSWACCNVPEINSELPRTSDEKSPPSSPPNASSLSRVDTPRAAETVQTSGKAEIEQPPSEPLEEMKPKGGVEIKLKVPPTSFKEL